MTGKTEPVLKRKTLVFGRYLDVSTGHVMEADLEELKREDSPITSYPYEEGVWVHVVDTKVTKEALRKLGFSEGFAQVYVAAQQADCWFIRLDCDGYTYERFPHYDW